MIPPTSPEFLNRMKEQSADYNIHRDISNLNNTLCWYEDEIKRLGNDLKQQLLTISFLENSLKCKNDRIESLKKVRYVAYGNIGQETPSERVHIVYNDVDYYMDKGDSFTIETIPQQIKIEFRKD